MLFSFQIIAVDHFSPQVDGVRLSLAEFLVVSVESTAAALLFETPSAVQFAENALPILYCGIMSSGVAYTLQILGQHHSSKDQHATKDFPGRKVLVQQHPAAQRTEHAFQTHDQAGNGRVQIPLAQLPLEMLHRAKKTT
ncbi:Uncharacterised protein [uncultured Clostridium sp.]|nr:Uncharacterised protein [uncultured Clostridium sp.]